MWGICDDLQILGTNEPRQLDGSHGHQLFPGAATAGCASSVIDKGIHVGERINILPDAWREGMRPHHQHRDGAALRMVPLTSTGSTAKFAALHAPFQQADSQSIAAARDDFFVVKLPPVRKIV
jgi:hypothetical protein